MASAFTHAFAAASIATLFVPERRGLVMLAAACSVLPDADVLAFRFGIPYEDMFGHRGITHSIAFAACLAGIAAWIATRGRADVSIGRLAIALFLATASHGVLDAMTNGGLGIAFFAPVTDARDLFPWRPIAVSPISVRRFFDGRGWTILGNEFVVVWIPALALLAGGVIARRVLWRR